MPNYDAHKASAQGRLAKDSGGTPLITSDDIKGVISDIYEDINSISVSGSPGATGATDQLGLVALAALLALPALPALLALRDRLGLLALTAVLMVGLKFRK